MGDILNQNYESCSADNQKCETGSLLKPVAAFNDTAYYDELLKIQNFVIAKAVRMSQQEQHKNFVSGMDNRIGRMNREVEVHKNIDVKRIPSLFKGQSLGSDDFRSSQEASTTDLASGSEIVKTPEIDLLSNVIDKPSASSASGVLPVIQEVDTEGQLLRSSMPGSSEGSISGIDTDSESIEPKVVKMDESGILFTKAHKSTNIKTHRKTQSGTFKFKENNPVGFEKEVKEGLSAHITPYNEIDISGKETSSDTEYEMSIAKSLQLRSPEEIQDRLLSLQQKQDSLYAEIATIGLEIKNNDQTRSEAFNDKVIECYYISREVNAIHAGLKYNYDHGLQGSCQGLTEAEVNRELLALDGRMKELDYEIQWKIREGGERSVLEESTELAKISEARDKLFEAAIRELGESGIEKPFVNKESFFSAIKKISFIQSQKMGIEAVNDELSAYTSEILDIERDIAARQKDPIKDIDQDHLQNLNKQKDELIAEYSALRSAAKALFPDQELELPLEIQRIVLQREQVEKEIDEKIAQYENNKNKYYASMISYKMISNHEDLAWFTRKFGVNHPLLEDIFEFIKQDPFYLKEVALTGLGAAMFYFSGNLAIPYSVLSNLGHKQCGFVGMVATKVGNVFGYENLGQKYCNEAAGVDLLISTVLGAQGHGMEFLSYSESNLVIRATAIASEYLQSKESQEVTNNLIHRAALVKEVLFDFMRNPFDVYGIADTLMDMLHLARYLDETV